MDAHSVLGLPYGHLRVSRLQGSDGSEAEAVGRVEGVAAVPELNFMQEYYIRYELEKQVCIVSSTSVCVFAHCRAQNDGDGVIYICVNY